MKSFRVERKSELMLQHRIVCLIASLSIWQLAFCQSKLEVVERSEGSGPMNVVPRIISTDSPVRVRPDLPRVLSPQNPKSKSDQVEHDLSIVPVADHDESQYFFTESAGDIHRSWDAFERIDFSPADPTIAAGPTDVVAAVNDDFSVYDKRGNLIGTWDINDFLDDDAKIFDPKVIYDVFDNRFLITWIRKVEGSSAATSDSSWILMVSDNSSAQGNWIVYNLDAQVVGSTPELGTWVDYPYVGVDDDGIALSGDMIGWFGGTGGRSRIRFLRKSQVYAGSSTVNWWDWIDLNTGGTMDRRLCLSTQTLAAGALYCVNSQRGGGDQIIVRRITNTTFANGTSPVSVKDVETVSTYSAPVDMSQGAGFRALDSMDCTIINSVTVNNHLVFSHATSALFNGATLRSAVKNYRYNTGSDSVIFESVFGSADYFTAFPATAATPSLSDTIVTFAMASPTHFPNGRFIGRLSSENSWGGSVRYVTGTDFYDRQLSDSRNRWGDYFGAALDPWDDETFWIHGMSGTGLTMWKTTVARVNRKPNTSLTLLNETAETSGTGTLSATLRRTSDSVALSGRTVGFYRGALFLGSSTTNASGIATLNFNVGALNPATYGIEARYSDALDYNGSEDTASLFVTKADTVITANSTSGTYSGNQSLTATLRRSSNSALLSGQLVTMRVNGTIVGTATTNANGVATVQFQLFAAPPSATITAEYGGSSIYEPSSDTGSLTIGAAPTSLQVAGGQGASGESVSFVAEMRRTTDSANVVGRTINFTFNGAALGSAVTNSNGRATLVANVPAGAPSQAITIGASFAGDSFYQAKSASAGFTRWARRIIGNVNLQNWVGNEQGFILDMNIKGIAGNQLAFVQAELDGNGNYKAYTNFSNNGTFFVTSKTFHWLSDTLTVSWNSSLPANLSYSLVNGDVNGDNEVGPADFGILSGAFGTELGDPGYSFAADLNGDLEVGPADFAILSANFGREGE